MGLISLSPKAANPFIEFSKKPYKNGINILQGVIDSRVKFDLYYDEEIKVQHSPHLIMCNSRSSIFQVEGFKRIFVENVNNCSIKKAMGNNVFVGLRDWSG